MKNLVIWFFSFSLAGIIISPFFWLKYLKRRNKWIYIFWSSVVTLVIFSLFLYRGNKLIEDWTAKTNADWYYAYYEIGQYAIYIVFFLIMISSFIFTKIAYGKITLKSFFVSLAISILIFLTYAYLLIYILWPMAAEELLRRI